MVDKYRNPLKFALYRARFALIRRAIAPLLEWAPLADAAEGYSVVIGCSVDLVPILRANLQMLIGQERANLRRVILVFDRCEAEARGQVEPALSRQFGAALPLEFVFYTPRQHEVMRRYDWGWTYCWLNWMLGLAACRTRYALIHDLDAMLVRRDLLESRYTAAHGAQAAFCGSGYYHSNGILESDRLLTTFEMVCDVAYLRRRFRPVDFFNLPARWKGRRVEFDTFLWPQAFGEAGARSIVMPIDVREMVHPSQMICQFMDVRRKARYVAPANNNVLMIPYFLDLGGDRAALTEQQRAIDASDGHVVRCFGRDVDFRHFSPVHARWLTEQATRLDSAVHGAVRPAVARYFAAVEDLPRRRAGGTR